MIYLVFAKIQDNLCLRLISVIRCASIARLYTCYTLSGLAMKIQISYGQGRPAFVIPFLERAKLATGL